MDWVAGVLALIASIVFCVRELCVKETPPGTLALQVLVVAATSGGGAFITMLMGAAWLAYLRATGRYDPVAQHMEGMSCGLLLGFLSSVVLGVWQARKIKDEPTHPERARPRPSTES